METGAARVAALDDESGLPPSVLLFVDADLGESRRGHRGPAGPVLSGDADMTIAVLPPQPPPGGGHGFVVNLSRDGYPAGDWAGRRRSRSRGCAASPGRPSTRLVRSPPGGGSRPG